jgi:hypothetical protein
MADSAANGLEAKGQGKPCLFYLSSNLQLYLVWCPITQTWEKKMSSRGTLFKMWTKNPSTLNMGASELAEKVGCTAASVNVYRSQFRKNTDLSPEQVAAGKRLRNSEQRRKWRIEEAVTKLIEEKASLIEMQAAGLQFVVLSAA